MNVDCNYVSKSTAEIGRQNTKILGILVQSVIFLITPEHFRGFQDVPD